jgi:hypothetical protein
MPAPITAVLERYLAIMNCELIYCEVCLFDFLSDCRAVISLIVELLIKCLSHGSDCGWLLNTAAPSPRAMLSYSYMLPLMIELLIFSQP